MLRTKIVKQFIKKYKIQRKFNKLSRLLKEEGFILDRCLQERNWPETAYWLDRRKKTMVAIRRILKKNGH